MPKAPSYTPNSGSSKRWYSHKPDVEAAEPSRDLRSRTSTRDMQEAPFDKRNISKVSTNMPRVFYTRINHQAPVFKYQNSFTDHDNRHAFQGHGVYFGQSRGERTLGKRLMRFERQLGDGVGEGGRSRSDYLRHEDGTRYGYDYRTTHSTSYAPICEPVMPAIFRRFRRCHTHPELCIAEPPTCTADFAPLPPESISTEALGQSLIPYAGHNRWKYSNNRIDRAYPDLPQLRTAQLLGTR
ncbi:hypothetical protein BOX15_Mlig020890g2 [Macrostomum lignano]|uniref:HDNR domain-containing protein n=2 Tax=Macrostomum lignano TaxID=282301 RepID=A0A1I8HYP6_9PLAT|nr:hypothetical protein BOX15_Mlig003974g2 [Macrostomum lignano]PAA64285.1 hypothetical protein BOX15_Mlig020890g2 [Macrostomum lignano]